ncbi:hypothetical protein [Dyadobacter sp. CY356]|uniref:hypothetical protein n=1 Tax=Dyadobacter sp. CY356 TaxID=2906442 RepID=UPI001F4048ED|nr:hypothetical protein [Dyadobacter sp. CY356]MCF0056290.1 hypothetical protein [Dyadobacter sp. CY356]
MKYIYCLLFLVSFISCKKEDEPAPSNISKRQAPFGDNIVDTQLSKVLYNGNMTSEFLYENGYLSEYRAYIVTKDTPPYLKGTFKRISGKLDSYEILKANRIVFESHYISKDMIKLYTMQFNTPETDTVQKISETWFYQPKVAVKKFVYNKSGFIIQERYTEGLNEQYPTVINYTRNAQNNIESSWQTSALETEKNSQSQFKYDTHPNPFFKIGVDRGGMFSVQSYSPNNIIEERWIVNNTYKVFKTYDYTYLQNGYPEKVTVKSYDASGSVYETYALDFIYN